MIDSTLGLLPDFLRRRDDANPPEVWSLFLIIPPVLARTLHIKLVEQRPGVVLVDEREGLARDELVKGIEDQRMAHPWHDLTDIDDSFGDIATAHQEVFLAARPGVPGPRAVMR